MKKMNLYEVLTFRSVTSILDLLQKSENKVCGGVEELLSIYELKHKEVKNNVFEERKHPLIVLEGLDGSGKTSVGKRFAKQINAQQWRTPPESVTHLRHLFDEHPELRTAYYSLGNYIAALEVQSMLQTTPVVMDRFWHSTTAYAIAQSMADHPDKNKMPPIDDEIFCWPEDLFKPDIVLFLNVSEEVRAQRQSRRTTVTVQEDLLNKSLEFRQNVIQAYKNMRNPEVTFINANYPFNKTLALIKDATKHLLIPQTD